MLTLLALAAGLGDTLHQQPLLAVAVLFGAGLLTSLTPCVYPMIPITAGLIAGSAGPSASRARTVGLTLSYVSGLALFYALLGVLAGLTGSLFGTVASSPWALGGIAILLAVFGLALLDVVPVPMPTRLVGWAGSLGGGSYPAVFLLGATSGIVAAPCGAPAFAAVLTWVATTGSALLGFVYLFVFSLGMTALLVVVGLFSGVLAALPRSGPWLIRVKRLAGILLIAVAGYYVFRVTEVFL
jgi:cytochrome c-type biogenesis protein